MPDRELNFPHDPKYHHKDLLSPEEQKQVEKYERELQDKIEFENQKAERWNFKENK